MAASQQWRQRSIMLAAILVVLFTGIVGAAATAASCYTSRDCPGKANAIAACTSGVCKYTCNVGWSDCDNNINSNGCEVNTATDVMRCGNCGRQCIPYSSATLDLTCVKGECVYTCHPGLSDCNNWLNDGCETRLPYNDDLRFCGACDTPCLMSLPNAISKCNRGKCEYTCNSGYGNCDNKWSNGCEKDLNKDVNNCNKCGRKCKVTLIGGEATCSRGKCGQQCKKGSKLDSRKIKCVPTYN